MVITPAMAVTVTGDLLRELAGFHASSGCAISIHLDLGPSSAPTVADVDAKFRARLTEAERAGEALATDRDCRLAVRRDVERIREWLDDEFDRDGARGLALFASSADDFFRALPLSEPIPDAVRVGGDLYVSPLADRFAHDGAFVAVVSRERGELYRLRNGRLEALVDETEEQRGRHDQGGWSQANYQRHIESHVHRHLKTVGGAIDRHLRRDAELVVVIGEELRSEFAATLPAAAAEAVIGWVSAEAHLGPTELLGIVRPVLVEADGRRHEQTLDRFREEVGRRGRAATGWQETLDVAADSRVDVLLIEEGVARSVWQCPDCGRAFLAAGRCPVEGAQLGSREDGAEVAVHHALANGGSVLRVTAGALRDADGIGALLRF
jgi:peptide chain release factor subunit 1